MEKFTPETQKILRKKQENQRIVLKVEKKEAKNKLTDLLSSLLDLAVYSRKNKNTQILSADDLIMKESKEVTVVKEDLIFAELKAFDAEIHEDLSQAPEASPIVQTQA